jgi:hypothetical protein
LHQAIELYPELPLAEHFTRLEHLDPHSVTQHHRLIPTLPLIPPALVYFLKIYFHFAPCLHPIYGLHHYWLILAQGFQGKSPLFKW